ncbi:hypothetical protein LCGC14_2748700 [marine sediment metagenome]|uniref:Gamma-glutamylcyclotransferase AIG2-like domain-containing protein n=1 Tax=marine sediment metagenome TaxID=412755 RepID=A0A0F9BU45_9ZZZZ
MPHKIGILAYGSLIDKPGDELEPLIEDKIECKTPFPVEFARKSGTCHYASTLVPYEKGCHVSALILVLKDTVSETEATHMLWRRERGKKGEYSFPKNPDKNTVVIESLKDFHDVATVLYTCIGSNIKLPLTPRKLAELAIESARTESGRDNNDGISYLKDAIKNGIETPLTGDYKEAILRQLEVDSLEAAWEKTRSGS